MSYVCVTFPPEKRHLLSQVLDEVFDGLLPALSTTNSVANATERVPFVGPRYGSTSELQGAADATGSRARRQYTPPFALFPNGRIKCAPIRRKAPPRFRITTFRPGNIC